MTPRRFFVLRPWRLPKPFQLLPTDKARGFWGLMDDGFVVHFKDGKMLGLFQNFYPKKEVFLKIGDFEGTALLFRAQAFQGM